MSDPVYDTRRTRLVLGVLLLAALALITIDYRGGVSSPLNGLRGIGMAIFGPIESGAAAVIRPVTDTVDAITAAPAAKRRISALERQNQQLRRQLDAAQLARQQWSELNRLLHLAGLGRYRIVAAHVIALYGAQGYEDTAMIDAGSRDGIKPNMTVVSGDGLVGKVTEVGPDSATVLLATDAASSVGGRVEGSQEIGIVSGAGKGFAGGGLLTFQLLDANAPLWAGQRIVTFGSQGDRPYVPGVPIGTVVKVEKTPGSLTRTALVRPFVRFSALDVVGVVIAPPPTDPRDSVLPPKPSTPPGPAQSPGASASPGPRSSPSGSTSPSASPAPSGGR